LRPGSPKTNMNRHTVDLWVKITSIQRFLLQAMVNSCDVTVDSDPCIRVASFFDHEEIGSTSAQGANSSYQRFILERLSAGDVTSFHRAMPQSYLVSMNSVPSPLLQYQRGGPLYPQTCLVSVLSRALFSTNLYRYFIQDKVWLVCVASFLPHLFM